MLKEVEIRPGLSLYCDPRFFPLTQDSVLLADFAAPQLRGCGLDLGIGQGYLAALTLLRAPRLTLEGLELIPEAAVLAQRNLRRAGFSVPVTVGALSAQKTVAADRTRRAGPGPQRRRRFHSGGLLRRKPAAEDRRQALSLLPRRKAGSVVFCAGADALCAEAAPRRSGDCRRAGEAGASGGPEAGRRGPDAAAAAAAAGGKRRSLAGIPADL